MRNNEFKVAPDYPFALKVSERGISLCGDVLLALSCSFAGCWLLNTTPTRAARGKSPPSPSLKPKPNNPMRSALMRVPKKRDLGGNFRGSEFGRPLLNRVGGLSLPALPDRLKARYRSKAPMASSCGDL